MNQSFTHEDVPRRQNWTPKIPAAVKEILERSCVDNGITLEMLRGNRKHKPISDARREAAFALRDRGLSTPVIARYLGGMHHTSVVHMLRQRPVAKPILTTEANPWDEWV